MKPRFPTSTLLSLALIAVTPALAYSQTRTSDDEPPGLPPPAMDDPGVGPVADSSIKAAVEPAAVTEADAVEASPETVAERPGTISLDEARAASLPVITVRTDPVTGDRVEETRENGKLVRVLVQPKDAPAYVLHDANGDGRVDASDAEGPVQPVYWELFKWD